jgi:hypothetical protein
MRDADMTKWLSAARLIELFATLPPDSRVMPNEVGNLLVLTVDGENLAFIDLAYDGEVEYFT